MNRSKIRLGIILAILVTITICSACGPGAEPPPPTPTPPSPPPPGANQPPQISSLTPAQTQAYPSDMIEIQCVASDPDGDTISYDWSTTGGKFTGTGPTVSWVAPEQYGDYTITVTVKDGKGGITQASVTMSVVQNMDPVISSLVANPVTVPPQGKSTITCVATDPDGDVLNYNWEVSDGSITGVGDTVTWVAPDREGEFTITVIVDDGKGGQNASDVSVTVLIPEKTVTLYPLAEETGTVSQKGHKDTSRTKVGDDETNVGYRAFWGFNTYSLMGTEIKDAKLTFTTQNVVGEPFERIMPSLAGLHLWRVRYEPGQLPDFDTPRDLYPELASVMWEMPTVIDVTDVVKSIARGNRDRFQIEAGFLHPTNGNGVPDYVEWLKVELAVAYVEK